MQTFWHTWCLFCGIICAVGFGGLVLVGVYFWIAGLFPRSKRSNFRACPTCKHEHAPATSAPCGGCMVGESMWTPKR